jgi:radical SAM superfamily enzyme YgiQ (UPF0313 family)
VRRCRFCNTANFWKKWRGRRVENVMAEIKSVYRLGVRYFSFNDSSFEDYVVNEERMLEIARGILDLGLDISYIAGFRAEFQRRAEPQMMNVLKKSGLRQVRIGIETANQFDRKLYGKYANLEDNGKIIELFREFNIFARVGFINFNPYSSFEGLRQNVGFLEEYEWAANYYLLSSRLTVYKGTGLFKKVRDDGLMIHEDTDSPKYMFLDKRIMELANFVQGYLYMANSDSNGGLTRICNFKNYYQSIVYDFLERFGDRCETGVSRMVKNFETEMKDILAQVNRRNAQWFRGLLDLAEQGWDNQAAVQIMLNHLNKHDVLETASLLDSKRDTFNESFRSMGEEYASWISITWDTIGNLII